MSKPTQTKPTTPPTTPQPKNEISVTIPNLKPKNQRGEKPKSQGIYFLHSKDEPKTDEEILEQKGYTLIPKIKEAVGSNNLKAFVVPALENYFLMLKAKGLVKEEEDITP